MTEVTTFKYDNKYEAIAKCLELNAAFRLFDAPNKAMISNDDIMKAILALRPGEGLEVSFHVTYLITNYAAECIVEVYIPISTLIITSMVMEETV